MRTSTLWSKSCKDLASLSFWMFATAFAMGWFVFSHFNPGALSPDSLLILKQARTGIFEDGHPPLMAAIWRLVDFVLPGSVGMLLLNLILFYGGLYLVFYSTALKHKYSALLALIIVGMSPPIVGIMGAIWIDITMAGFFLAAIGIFVYSYPHYKGAARIVIFFTALALSALGLAIRHNGAAAAFPLISYFLFQGIPFRSKSLSRLLLALTGGALVTFVLFVSAKQISTLVTDQPKHFWRVGAMYDIVGASYYDKKYLFHAGIFNDNSLNDINNLYSPRSLTPLLLGEQVHALPGQARTKGKAFDARELSQDLNQRLLTNWEDVILHHTESYLMHRYEVFLSLTTRSSWGLWAPVFETIDPNNLGIEERPVPASVYFDFARRLANQSLIFVPLPYLILCVLGVAPALYFGLRFRNNELLLASALYGSGLMHMIGLFVFAGSADFRYSHWMIVASTLGTSLILLEFFRIDRKLLRSPHRVGSTLT